MASSHDLGGWDCFCGYTNHRESKECRRCHNPVPPPKLNARSTTPFRSTQNDGTPNGRALPANQPLSGTGGPSNIKSRDTAQNGRFESESRQNLQSSLSPDGRPRNRILDDHIAATRATQSNISRALDSKEPKKDGQELAQNWKHIRRRSNETIAPAAGANAPITTRPSMKSKTFTTSKDGTAGSMLELERFARLEQTKDGRYIELNADSNRRKSDDPRGNQNFTERTRGEIDANLTLPSGGARTLTNQPSSRNVNSSTEQSQGVERNEFGRQNLTGRSAFSTNKGPRSFWKPSLVKVGPAAGPGREEDPAPTRNQSNQVSVNSEKVDYKTQSEGDADRKPLVFSRTQSLSMDVEPAIGRWKFWGPPPIDGRSAQSSGLHEHHGSAEEDPTSGYVDPQSNRVSIGYVAQESSETRESKKGKKKSRSTDNKPIDEFDMARRSFRAEASPYSRGMNRDRARQRQRKFDSEFEEDEDDRIAAKIERRQQRKKERAMQKKAAPPTPIYLPEFISVSNLAAVLRVRVEDFVSRMQALGFEDTNNDHVLDVEVAGLIAAEFNFEPIFDHGAREDLKARPLAGDKSLLPPRPPVVTIMGHVDHGKTTLLDWLRKSSVAASEYGGITQHIGAFSVQMPSGKLITFLDTPGHAAFLSMRQRGANVTDIVILVVAADDSVKPQTVEAIRHAQSAKVPIIVAVNKIDKEDSNVERVKKDLARYGVEIEDYGGDTQVVCVSGKTGQGMEELEDAAVALADVLDMRAEIDGQAEGWVLEATTKKAGRVATVLVRRGTLRSGDIIVAGTTWARVRSLKNEAGVQVPSAGPGTPVEIDGWREQPTAGDEVLQAADEQQAKSVVELRLEDVERSQMAADMTAVNEARRLEQEKREAQEKLEEDAKNADTDASAAASASLTQEPAQQSGPKEVFFLIKGDVSGSVEAVLASITALGTPEVRPHILRSGVGPVSEFDLEHAAAAKGHVIAFNVAIEPAMRRMAEQVGVKILEENIIYRLVDDVRAALGEVLPPLVTQRVLGEAEVAQVFEINTRGRVMMPVAGCRVRNGVIGRNAKVRVLRGKEVVYDGEFQILSPVPTSNCVANKLVNLAGSLSSLKIVKKDVAETRKGNECGMGFEKWTEFRVGDQVQCYEEKVEKRYL